MGLKKFEIQVNKPNHTFSPGEIVAGRVIVDLDGPKDIRSLKVKFEGKATVHWEEIMGTGSDESSTDYRSEEEYIKESIYMLGYKGNEIMTIETGYHSFNFEFRLPNKIPSSFETTHGKITYSLTANIDRPWKFDHKTSLFLTVEAPHDFNQFKVAKTAINDEREKNFCCLCCIMGALEFSINVPTNYFKIGDAIPANIQINNRSSVKVTKIEFELLEVINVHSKGPREKTKSQTKVLTKVKEERRFKKTDNTELIVRVPSLDFVNLDHCSIIDVVYYVGVMISVSGCHLGMKAEYRIVIDKSNSSDETAEDLHRIHASLPSARFFPVESSISTSGTPPYPLSYDEQFTINTRNTSVYF